MPRNQFQRMMFAFFTQLFFIQPENEQEVILAIFRRIDEMQEEIAHEHRQVRKMRAVKEQTQRQKRFHGSLTKLWKIPLFPLPVVK